ncbi:hypothetical protein K3759_13915 [Sulfitobacter sp. W027]|uniref:hypothetical protein n=1 Tax=Sulfitobacter sp. W027 TaxID=2867025 RepID=UPI0021A54C6E|nr:hypothetical protein [Sulfitobacter sp. W027]UWR33029.1 hypothetical protein K3759_13915 [Sulfitobacter sp. W027]
MSETTAIQKSERMTALILKAVLEDGIRYGTMLTIEKLDFEQSDEDKSIFEGCCHCLLDEGTIRCTNIEQVRRGSPLANPVITAHGFALLGQAFLSDSDERLGDAVRDVADGSASYSGLDNFVGGVLGGFTKSISS